MFPKLIDAGGFYLPTYGVLVAIAFLTAIWVTTRLATRASLPAEKVANLAIYCALAGMVGAKLFMFLFDWRDYAADPGQIFTLGTLQAAGVYQGGLVVAVLFAAVYMSRNNLPGFLTADVFAPGLALGHGIGRLGCFAAGCCWGQVCDRPWAVTFNNPQANQMTGVPLDVPLHPTQLYEAGAELVIFGLLWWYFGRPHRAGSVIGLYLVLYSAVRFVVEFYRNHEQALPFGLPLSITQWISLVTLMAGIALMLRPSRMLRPSHVGG